MASPPASWWLQRQGVAKFWDWLAPTNSMGKTASVRGPKQMIIDQAAFNGEGKWWPDFPTTETDLNRHRGFYSGEGPLSSMLETTESGEGSGTLTNRSRRRIFSPKPNSHRTSFGLFFQKRHPEYIPTAAPSSPAMMKPGTLWKSGAESGPTSTDTPMEEHGQLTQVKRDFYKYRDPVENSVQTSGIKSVQDTMAGPPEGEDNAVKSTAEAVEEESRSTK